MKPSDDDLMKLISTGDKVAFEQLFNRHSGHLLGYSYSFLGAKESCEDVTQDVWMKVIRLSTGYRGQGQFVSWLYTLTRNQCLTILRNQKRLVYNNQDNDDKELPSKQELEVEILQQQDLRKVQDALNTLPQLQRVALILHVVDGLSYEEISKEIESTTSAVKSLIFRARTHLAHKCERPAK